MTQPYLEVLGLPRDTVTLKPLVDAYAALHLAKTSPESHKNNLRSLLRFVGYFGGGLRVADLKSAQVRHWIEEHENRWKSAHTRRREIAAIRGCFSWALKNDLLTRNPAAGIETETPEVTRRPVTHEEFRRLLRGAPGNVRRLLYFLLLTGARPGEATAIRWPDVNLDKKIIVLRRHKTRRRTGKPRTFYLSDLLVKILRWMLRNSRCPKLPVSGRFYQLFSAGPVRAVSVKRWRRKNRISLRALQRARQTLGVRIVRSKRGTRFYKLPDGAGPRLRADGADFVFTNCDGGPWDRHALDRNFARLRARVGLPRSVILYGFRHKFATDAIAGGANHTFVSKMLGHSRTTVTEMVYCHLEDRAGVLCEAADEITKKLGLGKK